jgi:hypothetical protein
MKRPIADLYGLRHCNGLPRPHPVRYKETKRFKKFRRNLGVNPNTVLKISWQADGRT